MLALMFIVGVQLKGAQQDLSPNNDSSTTIIPSDQVPLKVIFSHNDKTYLMYNEQLYVPFEQWEQRNNQSLLCDSRVESLGLITWLKNLNADTIKFKGISLQENLYKNFFDILKTLKLDSPEETSPQYGQVTITSWSLDCATLVDFFYTYHRQTIHDELVNNIQKNSVAYPDVTNAVLSSLETENIPLLNYDSCQKLFLKNKPHFMSLAQDDQPFYKRHYWKAMASIGSSALILGIYLGIKLTMHYTRPVAA